MPHRTLQYSRLLGLVVVALLPLRAATAAPAPVSISSSSQDGGASSYIFFSAGDSFALDASDQQIAQAQKIAGKSGGELLWIQRGGKTWVVRDAALLAQVHALVDPQLKHGNQQGDRGGSQGELADKQVELGTKNAELGEQVLALKAQVKAANGQKKADLQKKLQEVDKQQKEIGRQQAEIGKQQAEIGKQQAEVGKQQGEEAKRAKAGIEKIFNDGLHKGLAQEVR
jgi:bla regulator protein BlaR1